MKERRRDKCVCGSKKERERERRERNGVREYKREIKGETGK